MRLPKNLLDGTYGAPSVILCEADKTPISQIEVINLDGTFKFNAYSEISFEFPRYSRDMLTGETIVNPLYNKLEALRLVYLGEQFGYFEIQEPKITGDGIKETKSITAYSHEYTLSQKYLRNFYINGTENVGKGEIDGSVYFYKPSDKSHSMLDLVLEKIYGWSIGHVDTELQALTPKFEVDRQSVYDFLVNDVAEKTNCFFEFDTINGKINVYCESESILKNGDGIQKSFALERKFNSIGSVTIYNKQDAMLGSFRTDQYEYNPATGIITFATAPAQGTLIEITDGYQDKWDSDVYVSFENLSNEMTIEYAADDIKTVLYGYGADELNFREVNMGLPYVMDLSYYNTVDWMGEELHTAYAGYQSMVEQYKLVDVENRILQSACIDKLINLESRLSLQYSRATVNAQTEGTYYTRSGSAPNYIYTEVQLPQNYTAGVVYYKLNGVNLTEEKINDFQAALMQELYMLTNADERIVILPQEEVVIMTFDDSTLKEAFAFAEPYTFEQYVADIRQRHTDTSRHAECIAYIAEKTHTFWAQVWEEYGLTPLKMQQTARQTTMDIAVESKFYEADVHSDGYCQYYANYIMLETINIAVAKRQKEIDDVTAQMNQLTEIINSAAQTTNIEAYFKEHYPDNWEKLMIRLSAFMREDEYTNDTILVTDYHTEDQVYKLKEELKQNTLVELSKLCKPNFKFSMKMANIYALPEFAPIANSFQLGRFVKIALRPDYIRRARLLTVEFKFDDPTDFSCEFGTLSHIADPADIHADLLAQAVSAGKSVASNKSYWNQSVNKSNSIDVKIRNGLLDANTSIKSLNGTQGVEIDKYGIHLREEKDDGSYDPKQVWMVNNKILFTDDNFASTKTVLGEFKYGDRDMYGILAEGVVGGLVAGSEIEGGTIKIGDRGDGTYNFEVDENGSVEIRGGQGIAGELSGINSQVSEIQSQINNIDEPIISAAPPENPNPGQLWIDTSVAPPMMRVMNGGVWQDVKAANDANNTIFISRPNSKQKDGYLYKKGDMWVVTNEQVKRYTGPITNRQETDTYYEENTILICIRSKEWDNEGENVCDDADWSDINNISELTDAMQRYQQVIKTWSDGLYMFAEDESKKSKFYSKLTSGELGFYSRAAASAIPSSENGLSQDDQKVVWISTDSLCAKRAEIKESLEITYDDGVTDNHPLYVQVGNFRWQTEPDGSFSLVKITEA